MMSVKVELVEEALESPYGVCVQPRLQPVAGPPGGRRGGSGEVPEGQRASSLVLRRLEGRPFAGDEGDGVLVAPSL